MTIKLDGKDNIIDNMYKNLPKRKIIENGNWSEEKTQKIIEEVTRQVTDEYYNKPVLVIKRGGDSDYTSGKK
jgi:hypothetical protein